MYRAASVTEIFIAYALLGFTVGFVEAPILTYVGEICEPSLRSLMIGYSSLSVALGSFFIFTLNTLMPWRMVALVCMFIPITTWIGLYFVSNVAFVFPIEKHFMINRNRFIRRRFLKLRYGYCQRIVRLKLKNPYNGFAVGFQSQQLLVNLKNCSNITNDHGHATHASMKIKNVRIHRQHCLKKFANSYNHIHWNHFSSQFQPLPLVYFRAPLEWLHSLCKFLKLTTVQLHPIKQRSYSALLIIWAL